MPQRITTLKTNQKARTLQELLEDWNYSLREQDRSPGTVKKYTQAVRHFLAWYEKQEHVMLTVEALTPIALIGYRNELQHAQHKSISTINLRISALRTWCGWMTEQGILSADPARSGTALSRQGTQLCHRPGLTTNRDSLERMRGPHL